MTISGQPQNPGASGAISPEGHQPANLGDILERVLDRGLVIVGDIRVSLLDIELLTIKLRLLIASVDTARQLGIDWWEHDPWLSSKAQARLTADTHRREQIEQRPEGEERHPLEPLELTPELRGEDRA
ncbi:MAG TPA: gas vesicle protein GvpJ [Candidatus Limnocylindrales bacterium]|nr:gas vesicle protein GvpJ [Candidatus Limnocylindrales bacterium]